jgi:hypothetical protein
MMWISQRLQEKNLICYPLGRLLNNGNYLTKANKYHNCLHRKVRNHNENKIKPLIRRIKPETENDLSRMQYHLSKRPLVGLRSNPPSAAVYASSIQTGWGIHRWQSVNGNPSIAIYQRQSIHGNPSIATHQRINRTAIYR